MVSGSTRHGWAIRHGGSGVDLGIGVGVRGHRGKPELLRPFRILIGAQAGYPSQLLVKRFCGARNSLRRHGVVEAETGNASRHFGGAFGSLTDSVEIEPWAERVVAGAEREGQGRDAKYSYDWLHIHVLALPKANERDIGES